jgi:hypothetical protein
LFRVLLFLIWPFGALFANLSYSNSFRQRVIFLTLFIGFFGFSFIILGDAADIVRIKDMFYQVRGEIGFGLTIWKHITRIYIVDEYSDPFAPFLAYSVAWFTGDHRFYIGLLGLIFGFFYSNVILMVDEIFKTRIFFVSSISAILFSFLLILIPVWQLNGIRFWTGAIFFIFYLLRYIYKGKSLGPILFCPFFHSAFFIWAPIVFFTVPLIKGIKVSKIQLIVLSVLLILNNTSFRLEALNLSGFSANASALDGKFEAYNKNKEEFEGLSLSAVETSWFLNYRYSFENYLKVIIQFEFVFVVWLLILTKKMSTIQREELNIIILIGLLSYSIALHPAPSAARFTVFFNYLVPIFFIRNMVFNGISLNQNIVLFRYRLVRFTFLFMLLFVAVVEIRNGFEYLNYALFLGNPFTIYFFGNETPLIEFYHAIFGKFAG